MTKGNKRTVGIKPETAEAVRGLVMETFGNQAGQNPVLDATGRPIPQATPDLQK